MSQVIAFEGIDGSGKTLQAELLKDTLVAKGLRVLCMSFPVYDSFFGRECGLILSGRGDVRADELDPKSMSLWYALDRWQAMKTVDMDAYDYVLLNRFTLSNVVYQSIRARDEDRPRLADWIFELEHVQLALPEPDIYVLFDVDPCVAGLNVRKKGHRDYVGDERDVYEQSTRLLTLARAKYLSLAQRLSNIKVVNCLDRNNSMRAPEKIAREVAALVKIDG